MAMTLPDADRQPAASRVEELVELAAANAPWAFLRALGDHPEAAADPSIRWLSAIELARAGLAPPARQLFAALPADLRASPAVAASRSLVDRPSAARALPAAERLERWRTAQAALARRGVDLAPLDAAARQSIAATEAWRSPDGGVLIVPAGQLDPARWRPLAPAAPAGLPPAEVRPPLLCAGLGPELVARWRGSEVREGLHEQRLLVVETDGDAIADAFGCLDLAPLAATERVAWFLGPDALERLADWLIDRIDLALPESVLATGPAAATLLGAAERVRAAAVSAQRRELARLAARADRVGAGKGLQGWRSRFGGVIWGDGSLRVLLHATRHSSYLVHAIEDLAAAFTDLGHDVRVLVEPDASSRLTRLAWARAIAEHEPDLIVVPNHPRAALGVPASIPYVCWIQDAMPHLFERPAGTSALDVWVGYTFPELTRDLGVHPLATKPAAIPASATKFHPGPVAADDHARFDCEIAFASNHGETPAALRDRLAELHGGDARARRLLGALHERAETLAAAAPLRPLAPRLADEAGRVVREVVGVDPEPARRAAIAHGLLAPLVCRIAKHKVVGWAAEIAERRGWRLRLFGRGWDEHSRFAPFAGPPAPHGEALRACYASAAVHLHVDTNVAAHQRVAECLLSGGLPLLLRTEDALRQQTEIAWAALLRAAGLDAAPEASLERDAVDAPEAMALVALRQRLGLPAGPTLTIPAGYRPPDPPFWRGILESMNAALLLGDLADVAFADAAELERRVEEALGAPERRGAIVAEGRARALALRTHHALAEEMIEAVANSTWCGIHLLGQAAGGSARDAA